MLWCLDVEEDACLDPLEPFCHHAVLLRCWRRCEISSGTFCMSWDSYRPRAHSNQRPTYTPVCIVYSDPDISCYSLYRAIYRIRKIFIPALSMDWLHSLNYNQSIFYFHFHSLAYSFSENRINWPTLWYADYVIIYHCKSWNTAWCLYLRL